MQYSQALDHLIREVVISNPELGPVHVLKADVSEGFYRIGLRPKNVTKLGLVFTLKVDDNKLVAILFTLPMGWKNTSPISCTTAKTVTDLENGALRCNTPYLPHKMDGMDESIFKETHPTLQVTLEGLAREPYLRRANTKSAVYVDIFVDNFLGLAQGPHTIDDDYDKPCFTLWTGCSRHVTPETQRTASKSFRSRNYLQRTAHGQPARLSCSGLTTRSN